MEFVSSFNREFTSVTKSRTFNKSDQLTPNKQYHSFTDRKKVVEEMEYQNSEGTEVINRGLSPNSSPTSARSSQLVQHYNAVRGLVCGFIAACSAGLQLDLIKIMLFYTDIGVFELVYQRSLTAFILVSLILYYLKISPFEIDKKALPYAFIRIIGSAAGFLLMIFSLEIIPVSKTVVIVYNPFISSLISYVTIGEKMSKHDILCFLVCTVGVVLLTDPLNSKIMSYKDILGIVLALGSAVSFNLSYVALRKIKDRPVNSWVLVFYIMVINLVFMPGVFLTYDVYKNQFTHYSNEVWILIILTGILTLSTLYFTNLMFYYEKAGRGAAYSNFELIFTYFFDVFYMKNNFKFIEVIGAWLIVMANIYLYVLKSLGMLN
ncbi:membrane protein [Stylonychia lemnae]|uniref:Membrane protein n=1 Tax=Stylonychia lemnae TaxID=5949 RepID=A0A078AIY7_STYLE|nr:membrane protein [Stylonychia lemnae]|eukprot:CDW82290.1 membrane protein [Stylonychia lemnae]